MITKLFPALLLVASIGITEASEEIDLNQFAVKYFEAKVATQAPDATPEILEAYLALLTEDVGYEHKPYRYLGEVEGGRSRMRAGMTYYLGGNEKYSAELVSVAIGHNAVAIQYKGIWSGRRGGEGPIVTNDFLVMEVLEITDGKVSLIREFSK